MARSQSMISTGAKPARVGKIHRRICAQKNCPHLATLDYNNPCLGCPDGHFGPYRRSGCNGETPALPSGGEMLKSGVGAIGQIIRHGIEKVSSEERARRLAICKACEFLIHKEGKSDRCAKCGCFLKWKTALESWHCPIKKW